mgnify:CR=1 FL=1
MNRLTKKSNSTLKKIEYQLIDEQENLGANEGIKKIPVLATNKLGKLEDIEEELGIDLIKAVELCKQVNSKKVVYIKDEWGFYPIKTLDELDIELFSHRLYKNNRGMCVSLDLYDYGETWALTKEELENDN